MRIANHLLDNCVAPAGVLIRAAIAQRVIGDAFDGDLEITLLFLKERAAVGYEIFEISELRSINCRIVNLRDDSIPNREPEMTGCGVSSANTILVAMRPAGLNTRFSKCFPFCKSLHSHTSSLFSLKRRS